MSKVVTPTAQPVNPVNPANPVRITHEKIAQRAFDRWVQRGRPHGTDVQDWLDAENDLRTEFNRQTGNFSNQTTPNTTSSVFKR